ncbi:MAG: hypothetical protein KC940_07950, partial [Candidatus Omnitrophica bacterium]|nr:hypothetical protein [Candidatus Omnitrophota bacterium]
MIVEEDSRYADDSLDEVAFSRIAIALAFLPLVVFPTLGLLVVQPFATLFLDNQTPVFSLLLAYPIVMVQIPFVAIASFQSMRFLENPTRVYETVWVRWGISIGVLVGAYFSTLTLGILFFVLSTEPWTLLILVFQLLLTILILWDGFGFFPDYSLNKWLFPVFLTLLVLISSIIEVGGPIVRPVFLLLVFAAPGFLMVEVGLSVYAWRIWWSCDRQSAPAKAPRYFPLGLLTLFTTTLIYSIKLAFVWRANLPPPQNCFIATAAA